MSRTPFGRKRRGQNKIDSILPHHIRSRLAVARFESRIRRPRKAERFTIVKFGLLGIADIKLDVMYFF
jgi:hypothetical protein